MEISWVVALVSAELDVRGREGNVTDKGQGDVLLEAEPNEGLRKVFGRKLFLNQRYARGFLGTMTR